VVEDIKLQKLLSCFNDYKITTSPFHLSEEPW